MFKPGTVVIVGAGASFEAKLPIGSELKDKISQLTTFKFPHGDLTFGNRVFFAELMRSEHFSGDRSRIRVACEKIARGIGFVSSVDNFLEIHAQDPDVQVCAKAAIAYLIADGERRSLMSVDQSNIYNHLSAAKLKDTWYQELAHILFEKIDGASIAKAFEPVKFISFNYDRCLEWFLYQSLMGLYAMDPSRAEEILKGVRVLHPYGEIGEVLGHGGRPDYFGFDISGKVIEASKRLLTYTEGSSPEIVQEIRSVVANADRLVFLGFAFHPQNMELLRPQNYGEVSNISAIFGTSHKMSENDNNAVTRQLEREFTATVKLADLTCCEFFRRYKRTLAV